MVYNAVLFNVEWVADRQFLWDRRLSSWNAMRRVGFPAQVIFTASGSSNMGNRLLDVAEKTLLLCYQSDAINMLGNQFVIVPLVFLQLSVTLVNGFILNRAGASHSFRRISVSYFDIDYHQLENRSSTNNCTTDQRSTEKQNSKQFIDLSQIGNQL